MKDPDWEEHVAGHLYSLVEHLATNYNVKRVVVMQILHRLQPLKPVRHPVDVT